MLLTQYEIRDPCPFQNSLKEISKYGKFPKISNSLFHTFLPILFFVLLFLKILSGMANIVDADQIAPLGAV